MKMRKFFGEVPSTGDPFEGWKGVCVVVTEET